MQDLLPVNGAPCANAIDLNASAGVIVDATNCFGQELDAVLWKNGTASSLASLVAPSPLQMTFALQIDDQGQIAGVGLMADGTEHMGRARLQRQSRSRARTQIRPARAPGSAWGRPGR